jgi:S1-C subfamily serine protease
MIVTAAHVVSWSAEGGMALGDYYTENVKAGRRMLKVQPLAVEPVADIAVLGAVDDQASEEFSIAADAFRNFCESTVSVPICTADFPLHSPFPVHILTHTGRWIEARAEQCHVNANVLVVRASKGIEGGTSGGPVVTNDGLLLGVVSTAGGAVGEPSLEVCIPRLHLAAPGWLVRRMVDPEWEARKMQEVFEEKSGMIRSRRVSAT